MRRSERKYSAIVAITLVATIGLACLLGTLHSGEIARVQDLYEQARRSSPERGIDNAFGLMNDLDKDFLMSRLGVSTEMGNQARAILQHAQQIGLAMRVILALTLLLLAWLAFRELAPPLRAAPVPSQRSAERQKKLSALGTLAAGFAHEVRNPLTSIKARLYTQRKALLDNSPAREDNEVIHREVGRLEQLVKDILEFALPLEPMPRDISVSRTIQETASLMQPGLASQQVRLETRTVRDSRIRVDPRQFKQVLVNLVQNGAESMSAGGLVVISASTRSERRVNPSGLCAAIEVTDHGPGIPAEVEERLFDPFFTTKEGGTGLGLSFAARIVENHGGAIEHRTGLKGGTTFCILLPVISVHGRARQDPPD